MQKNENTQPLSNLKKAVDVWMERWLKNYAEMLAAATADIEDD